MTTDQVTVTFTCKECSGTVLELPDDYTDDSFATCKNCKTKFGRWGDIKTQATKKVADTLIGDFKKTLRDSLKGVKGITFK
jgi:hypothetical protein